MFVHNEIVNVYDLHLCNFKPNMMCLYL